MSPFSRSKSPLLPVLLLSALFCGLSGPAAAQLTYLDEFPWLAPADSTSRLALVAEYNRFQDAKYDWTVDRLHLCAIMPAGEQSVFFLRMSHLLFDTGQVLPVQRWPWVRGAEEDFQWEDERTITSFGQPEVGALGPLNLPYLGAGQFAVGLGLPVGTDRLYPFASVSLPLRLALRKPIDLWHNARLHLETGYLMNMESGQDLLGEEAFPGGYELSARLDMYRGRGSRASLFFDHWDRDGRRSGIVGVENWLPWTPDGSVGIRVARELAGTLDGPAAWYFTLAWRFDSAGARPGAADEPSPPDRPSP